MTDRSDPLCDCVVPPDTHTIIFTVAQDVHALMQMQGKAFLNEAILPSGFKIPKPEQGMAWVPQGQMVQLMRVQQKKS